MKILFYVAFFFFTCHNFAQTLFDYPIKPVNITQVKLSDNFWLPKINTVQNTTINYALNKCSTEGRFDNFLIAGGVMQGETRGKMPFDDTDVYKIIEGATYSLLLSPDENLESYIDSIISIIEIGQEDDGYLTTWRTINPQKPPASWVEPGDRWHHLAASHELYNSGHLFEAAAAHYYATGKNNFLNIALKNADLLVKTFGPGKNSEIPGHQIVETGLIKLFQITKNKNYLELAKHFLDERGDSTNRKIHGTYHQDHMPLTQQTEVVGHAVRAVYMYAGMTDIAAIYHDKSYLNAVKNLWENMVYKKLYITGGIGARRDGEAFGENYELPNLTAYSETCAAIGSVYWNHRMFLLSGNVEYYDIIERTLYNGVIAGISLDGDEFFYPNPLESDGMHTFNQGACTRQSWFNCSCCPSNLIRFIPSVTNLIYSTIDDSLYINLFMSNKAEINVAKTKVNIEQTTNYPWDGKINIRVTPDHPGNFTLKIRIPGWTRNDVVPGDLYEYLDKPETTYSISINGKEEDVVIDKSYFVISKKWSADDLIEITFPMNVRRVITNENVKDNLNKVAFEFGPIVYCAEEIDNGSDLSKLIISDDIKFSSEKKNDLLGGVNILKGKIADRNEEITLIPYYTWSNRDIGIMKVWFPRN